MTVWICQCLCPDRHCILAATGEADSETAAKAGVLVPLRRAVRDMLRTKARNPRCGLCDANAATWRYELRATRFATIAEAAPALHELEEANIATNRAWGDLHRTRRPN